MPDGDVALSAGTDETLPFRVSEAFESAAPSPPAAHPAAEPVATGSIAPHQAASEKDVFDRLATALVPLLDQFTGTSDGLAGFDRLGVARGQLLVDDRRHNSVERFKDLAFGFERLSNGVARMSLSATGGGLHWTVTVNGERHADGRRSLAVEAQNLTLEDLRLVPGLRDPGFESDVPLGGRFQLTLGPTGKFSALDGRLVLGSGFFRLNDPDHEPLELQSITVPFRFDGPSRSVLVEPSAIATETANYQFEGRLRPTAGSDDGWAFDADGKGVVGPERPNETPILLDRIEAALRVEPVDRHLFIDKLHVNGPQVALGVSGEVQMGRDGVQIDTKAFAGRMPAPVILRLWPTQLSAAVRAWLLVNLQGGMVEHGTAVAHLNEADLAKMKQQRSVADSHLKLDYAVSGVTLSFMNGVPPLRGLTGTGVVTGDTSKFFVTHGTMDVSPGHQLTLVDGSLVVPSTDPKPTPAVITAHVAGGIDVLADLLANDALKSYADLPPQADSARGQIDGTLTVGLEPR